MLFGLRRSYLANFYGFFCFCLCLSFFFVVLRHIPDNDRRQLLSQDVYLNQVIDFSLQLFVLMTFKLSLKKILLNCIIFAFIFVSMQITLTN